MPINTVRAVSSSETIVTTAHRSPLVPAGPFTAVATALLAIVAAIALTFGEPTAGGGGALAAPSHATPADPALCPVRWLLASGRVRLPRGLHDPDNAVHEE